MDSCCSVPVKKLKKENRLKCIARISESIREDAFFSVYFFSIVYYYCNVYLSWQNKLSTKVVTWVPLRTAMMTSFLDSSSSFLDSSLHMCSKV